MYQTTRSGVRYERRVSAYGIPYRYVPPKPRPCVFKVAGKPGSNGRLLLVRCGCQHRGDVPLGEAAKPREARVLWDEHVTQSHDLTTDRVVGEGGLALAR
jgi:hypothetical protein